MQQPHDGCTVEQPACYCDRRHPGALSVCADGRFAVRVSGRTRYGGAEPEERAGP
ncbi:hypothetical protein [Streptomyces yunnanensis]|uniref:hypothetical protein n=1 Tax=Streptomyces yunnanensis TaxID=156453 RepID=UPI00142D4880|nr:hypothetical protein [Streptomyces yunnanensis]